jgi:hypothetical protein
MSIPHWLLLANAANFAPTATTLYGAMDRGNAMGLTQLHGIRIDELPPGRNFVPLIQVRRLLPPKKGQDGSILGSCATPLAVTL